MIPESALGYSLVFKDFAARCGVEFCAETTQWQRGSETSESACPEGLLWLSYCDGQLLSSA